LSRKAGHAARKVAALDWIEQDSHATLVVVDPRLIFSRETVQRLLRWLAGSDGRVLVLPKSALYSEAARTMLESSATGRKIEINLGVSYRLQPVGEGRLVVYDPGYERAGDPKGTDWNKFFGAMLALAEIGEPCRATDARLDLIPLERRDQSVGLFVLNGTRGIVSGDILFSNSVTISDLTSQLKTGNQLENSKDAPLASRRFSLDVPPCGVLPLAVDRVGLASLAENAIADQLGGLGAENAAAAAFGELPGLEGGPSVWN
jgi:hypothetical protein